jgi:hypothetical protein
LIDLELSLQLLNQRRQFLLPFRFDLVPERLFDFAAFLNVAGFKLSTLLRGQTKTRLTKRCIGFPGRAEVPYSGPPLARAERRPSAGPSVGAIAVAAAPAR